MRPSEGDWKTSVLVRIGAELSSGRSDGFVVTFDDITELLAAQRNTAWSDVARRIAHEIKNPLTPIQLSAERLQFKLADRLDDEGRQMLERSTQTIVNQVEAMKNLVNAFRDYARLINSNPRYEQARTQTGSAEAYASALQKAGYDGATLVEQFQKMYAAEAAAEDKIKDIQKAFWHGLVNEEERYTQSIQVWHGVKGKIEKEMKKNFDPSNPIFNLVDSGARGNW